MGRNGSLPDIAYEIFDSGSATAALRCINYVHVVAAQC